ncbi:MAG TPA: hypothetical protein DEA43_03895 [Candidatus Moranbacteria bacterium]|nr:hypothetical protein [Candidatus Moranbacteria bacterium]HBT45996.1 hypothetical protein [Candidatus Moranbacteria bacterium]
MKINFTLAGVSGIQLASCFQEAIGQEGIGFEEDFNSSATLSEDGTMWITAWSGFKYAIMNPSSSENATVQYDGALNGFQCQELLPFALKGEVQIISVEGTYGSFEGNLAIEEYNEIKKNFEAKIWNLKEEKNLPAGNGWDATKAAAIIFSGQPEKYFSGSFSGGWAPSEEYQKVAEEELAKIFPEKSYAVVVIAAQHLALTSFSKKEEVKMNLVEHFNHQLQYPRQWVHAEVMGAIAHLAQKVQHFDEAAKAVLTDENARILGEYVLSMSDSGQSAANFTITIDRSGCNEKITYISYGASKKMLMHFAGDRCNAPASETNWCWK